MKADVMPDSLPKSRSIKGSYTYSIMFYYTAEFAAATPNIEDFIDQVIAETNQGYANSEISITVTKLCQELATVPDQTDARALLREFKQMKGTVSELRNTADAAALLSVDISHCGMAYMATATSGNTLSVTKKSCALGYYSFGHEVAHNLGASHNKEVTTNNNFDDGHAHLIEKGAASTGYRTILGYYADGHDTRVNYYSNPAIIFPLTGTPTGVVGVSNNAAVLMKNVAALSELGDESGTCADSFMMTTESGSTLPTTSTTITTAITTTSAAKCNPAADDWHCCTASSPCGLGYGDCDTDEECEGPLVCGDNNCEAGDYRMDCCQEKVCLPGLNDWTCCTESSPCGLGNGDCDSDIDCQGILVCGDNNCADGDYRMDCCQKKPCNPEDNDWHCCTKVISSFAI